MRRWPLSSLNTVIYGFAYGALTFVISENQRRKLKLQERFSVSLTFAGAGASVRGLWYSTAAEPTTPQPPPEGKSTDIAIAAHRAYPGS